MGTLKKKTAIQVMAERLEYEIGFYIPREKTEYIRLIISNCKSLEKEQIIEAWQNGAEIYDDSAEQYFNEIFGGDK
jgi:hypothetical protein